MTEERLQETEKRIPDPVILELIAEMRRLQLEVENSRARELKHRNENQELREQLRRVQGEGEK